MIDQSGMVAMLDAHSKRNTIHVRNVQVLKKAKPRFFYINNLRGQVYANIIGWISRELDLDIDYNIVGNPQYAHARARAEK